MCVWLDGICGSLEQQKSWIPPDLGRAPPSEDQFGVCHRATGTGLVYGRKRKPQMPASRHSEKRAPSPKEQTRKTPSFKCTVSTFLGALASTCGIFLQKTSRKRTRVAGTPTRMCQVKSRITLRGTWSRRQAGAVRPVRRAFWVWAEKAVLQQQKAAWAEGTCAGAARKHFPLILCCRGFLVPVSPA